ncbi:MAG: GNAT family N-acetyltransferase [Bacteroidota bacterium]
MDYCCIEEYKIPMDTRVKIVALLQHSFEAYPQRTYYKQVPDFRMLVEDGSNLLGHMAVEHRVINMGGVPIRIFGVIDLCVAESHKSRGIASTLLQNLEKMGNNYKVDFIVLFADDHRLYLNNGFELATNPCRWLMINDHQSLGVARRSLKDCFMIKQLGKKTWKEGEVDMMGTVF